MRGKKIKERIREKGNLPNSTNQKGTWKNRKWWEITKKKNLTSKCILVKFLYFKDKKKKDLPASRQQRERLGYLYNCGKEITNQESYT